MTMSELGRRLDMSSPAITDRVQRLEDNGIITGYRLELDPRALGWPVAAFVRIRPGPGQLNRIADLARQTPEVVECHRITGEDCFLMKVYVTEIDKLEEVLDRFLMYGQTTSSIVQSSPVPGRPLPLPGV
jgi:Lrp/AsnC family leucine-responsive transcriptional regulator